MDSNSDEQTELLRNIWNHLKELDRSLGGRIDGVRDETKSLREETKGLRDETKGLREETKGLRAETRNLGERIEILREDLGLRLDHIAVDLGAMRHSAQVTVDLLIKEDARQDGDIAQVRERVARIEEHVGLPVHRR